MRSSDWSSDVCSSELGQAAIQAHPALGVTHGNGVCLHDCRLSPPAACTHKVSLLRARRRSGDVVESGFGELVEITLGIERSLTAGAGRGNRLTIDMVPDIPGCEHADRKRVV